MTYNSSLNPIRYLSICLPMNGIWRQ